MVRKWQTGMVLVAAVIGCLALPSLAGAADEPGSKPNILSPRFDLTIWTIVVFGLLLLVLKKYAWGPMLEGLQKREHSIQGALDEAQRARDEAHRLRTQFQGEMDQASEKVRQMMEEARRDAQRTTDEMVAKARGEIQTERDRLRREIDRARDQALQELWAQTARLASLVSSKALRRQVTIEDHRRLVDEAIADLREAGTERQRQVVG